MRRLVVIGGLAVVLGVANWAIIGKERVLASGQTMLLRLAPRDPRSLLQGDYMALRYVIADEIRARLSNTRSATGEAVVALDGNDVARFVRLDSGAAELAPNERLLRYRLRGGNLRLATDAFFFEEGQGDLYADARYGELVVDDSGDAVLTGLRGENFARLGPAAD